MNFEFLLWMFVGVAVNEFLNNNFSYIKHKNYTRHNQSSTFKVTGVVCFL